jgi:hypothetical protein
MSKRHATPKKVNNDMAVGQQRGAERSTAALPVLLVGSRRPSSEEVERDAADFTPFMNHSGRTSRNLIARHTKAE